MVSTFNVNDADNANNDGGVDDVNDVNDEEDADETCAEHVGGDADTARAHCWCTNRVGDYWNLKHNF